MNLYIYWLWGRSETGVVFADTEEEAKQKVINHYNIKIDNLALCYQKYTLEELVYIEKVNNNDVIEVYSE